ncbi:MAG: hypothetical protein ABSC63_00545 [Candidatus Binataceae bacterium]
MTELELPAGTAAPYDAMNGELIHASTYGINRHGLESASVSSYFIFNRF